MNVSISNLVSQIRIYEDGKSYENRDPYIGILSVLFLSDTKVYICGAHGTMNKNTYAQIVKTLKDLGVNEMVYERKGKLKIREI